MAGVVKIQITESELELKKLLRHVSGPKKDRVQALYWLKIGVASTTVDIAFMLNCHRTTVSRWLTIYRSSGMKRLLEDKKSSGRPRSIPSEAVETLKKELEDPLGFNSYGEIVFWLNVFCGLDLSYSTVYKLVRHKLKAKLKIPRPRHIKQEPGIVEQFKKGFPKLLLSAMKRIKAWNSCARKVRFWCQDETRIGLITSRNRRITGSGVKPIQTQQWQFDYFWLYGLIEPKTGAHFLYELSHLDTSCFEKYLELFSEEYPEEIHIIQLDNSPAHQSMTLSIPENVILLFQPPYSPEVNPIERLWMEIKKQFKKWEWFKNLDELRQVTSYILEKIHNEIVASLSQWSFIVDALCVANI